VLATARDVTALARLRDRGPHVAVSSLDVGEPRQCAAAVSMAVERFGGVDVLVNNAGYGQFGVVEEVSDAELAAQFDTNVYGPWRLVREVLPLWRGQGGGHAIFSSSLSGSMAFPGLSAYTASKFALEGLAEALAAEASQFGVKVTILQLGGFATPYGSKLREPARRIDAYDPVAAGMLATLRATDGNPRLSPPSLFAEVVSRLAELPDPPLRLPFGTSAVEYLDAVLTSRRAQLDHAKSGGPVT
jgi:NAD(P)-dependent dehydrogenase (short-subunit alcohol dehydrogenase family)